MSKLFSIEILKLNNPPEFDKYNFKGKTERIILKYLNDNKKSLDCYKSIKRGDVVHIKECGDRCNDGIFLYAGNEFVLLDRTYDDEGYVPTSFVCIEEFSMNYWVDTIPYNTIFHIRGRHLNNLKYERKEIIDGFTNYFYSFIYLNRSYSIRRDTTKKRIKKFSDDTIITVDDDPDDISYFIYLDA